MKTKFILFVMLAAMLFGATAVPSTVLAKQAPIQKEVTGTTPEGGFFGGTFSINEFIEEGGQIYAVGLLKGKVYSAAGKHIDNVKETIKWPVPVGNISTSAAPTDMAAAQVTPLACDILHLVLGPLHLDLLGLVIDLNQLNLDIVAEPAGGLLGTLLCGIANLLNLNPPNLLTQLVGLLNQILGALG